MKKARDRSGRPNATGRSDRTERYVALRHYLLRSDAYLSLEVGARALLVELYALYNGSNNGQLFLSVRTAAQRLRCSKNFVSKCFAQLKDRGFIRLGQRGGFNMKSAARNGGAASTWILTEHPVGDAKGAGSREFMSWRPLASAKASTVPLQGHSVPLGETEPP